MFKSINYPKIRQIYEDLKGFEPENIFKYINYSNIREVSEDFKRFEKPENISELINYPDRKNMRKSKKYLKIRKNPKIRKISLNS